MRNARWAFLWGFQVPRLLCENLRSRFLSENLRSRFLSENLRSRFLYVALIQSPLGESQVQATL